MFSTAMCYTSLHENLGILRCSTALTHDTMGGSCRDLHCLPQTLTPKSPNDANSTKSAGRTPIITSRSTWFLKFLRRSTA